MSTEFNVFLFNFIKNNQNDIEYLTRHLEARYCKVKVYEHQNWHDLKVEIAKIREMNFDDYRYVVIGILSNTNPCYYKLRIGNEDVRFNTEIIGPILSSPNMHEKKRLILLQVNQDFEEDHEEDNYTPFMSESQRTAGSTIEISSVMPGHRYETDHWSQPNAAVSPFIKSFSDNFVRCSNIADVFANMRHDMKNILNCEVPPSFKSNDNSQSGLSFGLAVE